jgi:hypothetical protein
MTNYTLNTRSHNRCVKGLPNRTVTRALNRLPFFRDLALVNPRPDHPHVPPASPREFPRSRACFFRWATLWQCPPLRL